MATCKENVLKYWKSWQINNVKDMEDTVADDFELFMFGEKTPTTKESLLVGSFENGTPWRNVEMISEVYGDKRAALLYRGISTATDNPVVVSEHLELDDHQKINCAHAMIFPPPNFAQ